MNDDGMSVDLATLEESICRNKHNLQNGHQTFLEGGDHKHYDTLCFISMPCYLKFTLDVVGGDHEANGNVDVLEFWYHVMYRQKPK